MSVKKDATGRRSISVEVVVQGTPEQVWHAIATGPGVSSWFVPAQFEGASMHLHFGPGMDSTATITEWDPPRRFAAESHDMGPKAPPVATEWIVEARGGGTCVVRVVHSLFASTDDWDGQLTGLEEGWPAYFAVLRHYLARHFGQPTAQVHVMSFAAGTTADAWSSLASPLGLAGERAGQRTGKRAAGVPPFSGVVESANATGHALVVRLEEPAPGVALVGAYDCGVVMAAVSLYLFGPDAEATAKRDEPAWQTWVSQLFPQPSSP